MLWILVFFVLTAMYALIQPDLLKATYFPGVNDAEHVFPRFPCLYMRRTFTYRDQLVATDGG